MAFPNINDSIINTHINNNSQCNLSIGLKISGKGLKDTSNANNIYDYNGIGFQLWSNSSNNRELAIIDTSNATNSNYSTLRLGITQTGATIKSITSNNTYRPLIINDYLTITSNRVGIGTTNPLNSLDVRGNITLDGNLLRSDGSLFTNSQWSNSTITSNNIYYNLGNIGIGTTNPIASLDIRNGNLILDSNSRIGIGITNPQYAIDINNGNVNIGGNLLISLNNTNNNYNIYTSNSSITFSSNTIADLLLVGAGGNGGYGAYSGGGGAGEVIYYPNYSFTTGTYNLIVGSNSFNTSNRITKFTSNNIDLIKALGGGNGGYSIYSIFNYTGTIQNFTIPNGISSVNIYCWGGGGGSTFSDSGAYIVGNGGTGGFVKVSLNVSSITTLSIIVGQGGRKGVNNGGSGTAFGGGGAGASGNTGWNIGGGGGLSAVFINDANMTILNSYRVNPNAIPIVIAGGGGSGGSAVGSYLYGGNGGSYGNNGNNASGTNAGSGGTQTSSGTVGDVKGDKFMGGNVAMGNNFFLTGGGAGFYGGNSSISANGIVGAAGGGSSYLNTPSFSIVNLATGTNPANGTAVAGSSESYYQTGIAIGGTGSNFATLTNGGNGLVVIEYITNIQPTIGGSGGGGSINQSAAVAGTKWNATYSYVSTGSNGTLLQGGNGGSAIIGGFIEPITGTNIINGIGGTGATATSIPTLRTSYGSGGDGNGGLGTQGIVIIKVPLNITKTKFDGYINYSNIENFPYINDLVASKNFIDIGYYNQVNFPLANISFANEWFIYRGTSPTNTSNSLVFWHLTSNINSKWWFNGTIANTNNEISDQRVKKEITNIANPLDKIMLLQPKEYMLCDDKNYLKKYGIIAQDVKQTTPEFVYTDEDYIANIYTNAIYSDDNNIYKIQTTKDISNLINIHDELKILLDNNDNSNIEIIIEDLPYHNRYKKRFVIVKSIIDNYTIEITEKIEATEIEKLNIFIYGKKVSDFLKLDYSSLYTLNIASIQELYKLICNQQSNINYIESKI
jgi:hypothetical protein